MSKIIYVQDTHIKGKNSSSRIGDYYSDVMTKIKEVIKIAKKKKCSYILHGGDLWDSELVSNVMVDDFIDEVEKAKIRWLILPGNHDMIGNNWNLSKATSLAHIFRRSKLIEELTILPDVNKFKFIIEGFKYYHNIEKDIKDKGLKCQAPNAEFKIAVVHALVTLKSLPYEAIHVVAKDIKADFDVVLISHNHQNWGIKEINGTQFINIGCLGRRKIDEAQIKPSALLIDTETKQLEIIELKSAKKAEEVFDFAKLEKARQFNYEIENFIQSLSDTKLEGLDIAGLIEHIAQEKKIDREIIDEAIKRIG